MMKRLGSVLLVVSGMAVAGAMNIGTDSPPLALVAVIIGLLAAWFGVWSMIKKR